MEKRGTVRDAQIGVDIVQDIALHLAVLGLGNGDVVTYKKTLSVLSGLVATARCQHEGGNKKKEKAVFHTVLVFVCRKGKQFPPETLFPPSVLFIRCSNLPLVQAVEGVLGVG